MLLEGVAIHVVVRQRRHFDVVDRRVTFALLVSLGYGGDGAAAVQAKPL